MENTATEIWKINDEGEMSFISIYTLPAKEALICYRQQNEFKNYNSWDYPKDDHAIKEFKTKPGTFVYFTGENTSIYTRACLKPA